MCVVPAVVAAIGVIWGVCRTVEGATNGMGYGGMSFEERWVKTSTGILLLVCSVVLSATVMTWLAYNDIDISSYSAFKASLHPPSPPPQLENTK